ncbi:MAG: hypothetical protein LBG87_03055 [Spirochaetaceae bacterium]|nr:hypothetical protein [Spirochaetaceae bacterium]
MSRVFPPLNRLQVRGFDSAGLARPVPLDLRVPTRRTYASRTSGLMRPDQPDLRVPTSRTLDNTLYSAQ